jgi:hypothetical protein
LVPGWTLKNTPLGRQAGPLSATLVRFYFCFIINFGFLAFRIVLFVFLRFIFKRTLDKMVQTFFVVGGSSVDTYINLNVAVYCDTILLAVLVFSNNLRFTRAYVHVIVVFSKSRSQNVKVCNGNRVSHNLKNKRGNRLMYANASKH